jgi:hypothetical protein
MNTPAVKPSWNSRRVRGALLLFFAATSFLSGSVLLARKAGFDEDSLRTQILQGFQREQDSYAGWIEAKLRDLPAAKLRTPTEAKLRDSTDTEPASALVAWAEGTGTGEYTSSKDFPEEFSKWITEGGLLESALGTSKPLLAHVEGTGLASKAWVYATHEGELAKLYFFDPELVFGRQDLRQDQPRTAIYDSRGEFLWGDRSIVPPHEGGQNGRLKAGRFIVSSSLASGAALIVRGYSLPLLSSEAHTQLWQSLSLFAGIFGVLVALSLLLSWLRLRQQSDRARQLSLSTEAVEARDSMILALQLRNLLPLYDLLSSDVIVSVLGEFWRRVHLVFENTEAEFIGRPSESLVVVWKTGSKRQSLDKLLIAIQRLWLDLDEMNESLKERALPRLHWGLAIHAGAVKRTWWNYPDRRRELGFLGSPIHEALRICALVREQGSPLVLSEMAWTQMHEPGGFVKSGEAWLRGRNLQLYSASGPERLRTHTG